MAAAAKRQGERRRILGRTPSSRTRSQYEALIHQDTLPASSRGRYPQHDWSGWIDGTMTWSGPRTLTGWRRGFIADQQDNMCDHCSQRFPCSERGLAVFEIDHIVPWHVRPDSSRPNLHALCGTCHDVKSAIEWRP